jgi:hypothetical protein
LSQQIRFGTHTAPLLALGRCGRDGLKEIEFCHKWFKCVASDIVEARDFSQEFLFVELIIENVDFVDDLAVSNDLALGAIFLR